MNKRILLSTGLAMTLVLAAGTYHKAFAVTDTGTATAVILEAITVDCSAADLDFGSISPSGTAGVVTMSTGGTATGDANATAVAGGNAGECVISGDGSVPADIAITATTSLDDAGAGAPMALSNFVLNYNGGGDDPAPITGATLVTSPGATLLVGADLAVGANQVAGVYTGSFTVDVVYQ